MEVFFLEPPMDEGDQEKQKAPGYVCKEKQTIKMER